MHSKKILFRFSALFCTKKRTVALMKFQFYLYSTKSHQQVSLPYSNTEKNPTNQMTPFVVS